MKPNVGLILAASMAVVLTIASPSQATTIGSIQFNPTTGHWYALVLDSGNWTEEEQYTVSLGGHLVTLNDAAEELWVRNTFGSTIGLYIGFNDMQTEGDFVWSSGEAVSYTNWYPGEPNNTNGVEDFTVINFFDTFWNDNILQGGFDGVAEFDEDPMTATPEPASLTLMALGATGLLARRRRKQVAGALPQVNALR